ncbi:trithorax group protein osa-like [Frankliniella occidentalis]|uniref:Trithorax group protein osa-like n=1 Tax=Frankliniella occidentalis TaxID=133901 RepID=A0A9C6XWQ6_FRAOC|nr:trithorax group protein osa-like [Frankliniella occidentalis]
MAAKLKCSAPCPETRRPCAMLLRQRLQVAPGVLLQLLLLVHSARPQRLEDIANQITPHGGLDRSGNFNVFFIPAYRLTGNRTGPGQGHSARLAAAPAAAPAASPSTPTPPLRLDPQTSARLLTAALTAAARLTAAPSPPPPAHTTPAPTLPPPRAGLVRRAPQDGDDPPPQHHDAHILVTLQNYGGKEAAGASAQPAPPASPPPQGAVGYGSAQHFNNYPAVNGHVPAHFGPIPYYSHFPVAAPGTGLGLTGPSAPSGPGGGLFYQPLPRFSAAASALDLVSSSPLGVNPGTLLGTTGPLYATPGRPAGTLANLGSLGSLASAAASATVQDTAATTTTDADQATTNVPVTTTTAAPVTSPTATASTAKLPTTEATATSSDPKADVELDAEPRTTPFRQTFEFGRTDSSRRLNLTEEVEVTASVEASGPGGGEATTPPQPTPATQQTSPATATEVRDLNSPAPTPPQSPAPTDRAETEPPALPPGPPYHFHPEAYPNGPYPTGAYPGGPYPTGPYPTGAYPTGAYQAGAGGIPLNGYHGYHTPDLRFRDDPYRDTRFDYQSHQQPQQPQPPPPQKPTKQQPAKRPAVSRNPNHFGGNFDPFGAFIPGFAPGYPFGVPPHGVDQRGQPVPPFGQRPPGFGPPYGPFPATGSGGGTGGGGSNGGGSAGGSGGGSAGGSGGSSGGGGNSQEATDDADDARPPPARLQAASGAEPSGSGEDLTGRQPLRQQQLQQLQQFGGFGSQLPQHPYSAFQSTAPGGAFPVAPNSFYRGAPGAPPTAFGQPPGAGVVAPSALANFNSASQFASEDFLGRQRLPALYPGASGGGRGAPQQQQLRSPLFTPQQGLGGGLGGAGPGSLPRGLAGGLPGGVAGLGGGGLDGGRGSGSPGGPLFGAQQPFAFNSPLFFSGSLDRDIAGDVEPRQSRITSYTASSSGGLKGPEQDKLLSANVNADDTGADDDLLGPAVGTLGLEPLSAGHHLERREDRRAAVRAGFYGSTR